MGAPKLLLPWGERTVLEQVLDTWLSSSVTHVVVVVRAEDEPLRQICGSLPVTLALAETPPPHMKDSIRCGLGAIRERFAPTEDSVWLLAPADMPTLTQDAIEAVLAAHQPARPCPIVPVCDGRRGHPLLLPWRLAEEVERLAEHEGVRDLLARHSVRSLPLPSRQILEDLDTPEDYRRLRPEE